MFSTRRSSSMLMDVDQAEMEDPELWRRSMANFGANIADLLEGENQYPLVAGVLAVKVVSAEVRSELDKDSVAIARLRVRNITKYTDMARQWGSKLTWGHMSYFPMNIIRNPRHPFNLFQIDLLSIPQNAPFEQAVQDKRSILGSVPFHVHDLVKGSPSMGSFTVLSGHRPIGEITLEIYFTYGKYGYGYSPQFKTPDPVENGLEFSMLPRSIPKTLKDEWSQTMLVQSKQNVKVMTNEEREANYPIVHSRMKRLELLEKQYDSIDPRDRLEKIKFLYKKINDSAGKLAVTAPAVFEEDNAMTSRDPSFFQKYMRPTLSLGGGGE